MMSPLMLPMLLLLSCLERGGSSNLFPVEADAVTCTFPTFGSTTAVNLTSPFTYYGTKYSTVYISRNGFVSFYPPAEDQPVPQLDSYRDLIAPMWAYMSYGMGVVTYQQGSPQSYETTLNSMLPEFEGFTLNWTLIITWTNVQLQTNQQSTNFQMVLAATEELWNFVILKYDSSPGNFPSIKNGFASGTTGRFSAIPLNPVLVRYSNVGRPGTWAYEVHREAFVIFRQFDRGFALVPELHDGNSPELNLTHPFMYFGTSYSHLYINKKGVLTFTEPLTDSSVNKYANMDLIAPLWTDLSPTSYNIRYGEATLVFGPSIGDVLSLKFNLSSFSPTFVFCVTWDAVPYSDGSGSASFYMFLVTDGTLSFIMFIYTSVPLPPGPWMAGYGSINNLYNKEVDAFISNLTISSNVGIKRDWFYRVDSGTPEPCGSEMCASGEMCSERNSVVGCYCSTSNPKPNPDIFDATVTCSAHTGTVSLSRCQLMDAGISLDSVHLIDPTCTGTVNGNRVEFEFNAGADLCGGTVETTNHSLVYRNSVGTSSGLIARVSGFSFPLSCSYSVVQQISTDMNFHTAGNVITKDLPAAEGTYRVHMYAYPDRTFSSAYSGEVTLRMNQDIFVQVTVEEFSSGVALVMESCWATPDNNTKNPHRWDLITDECPAPQDSTVEVLENGGSLNSSFSFKMFVFTGSSSRVFLHCRVSLCLLATTHCTPTCSSSSTRRRRAADFHDTAAISMSF